MAARVLENLGVDLLEIRRQVILLGEVEVLSDSPSRRTTRHRLWSAQI